MQSNPPPSNGLGNAFVGIVLFAAILLAILAFGPILLGGAVMLFTLLFLAAGEFFEALDDLLLEVAGGQLLMLGAVALGWWTTRTKVYAPLVGLAAGGALAMALPVVLQPVVWWLGPLTVLGSAVLSRAGRHTEAGAFCLVALAVGAATYAPLPKGADWASIGQFMAIAGTLVAYVLCGGRDRKYYYLWLMVTGGFVTLLYTQDVDKAAIHWDAVLRPVALGTLIFLALGVLGPWAAFHLRRGKRTIGPDDHIPGAVLALCAVALVGWSDQALASGFATPGWGLLLLTTLFLWTFATPHSGRRWQAEARVLVVTGLMALLVANPSQGNLQLMACVLVCVPILARPAWALFFIGAAIAAALGHGGSLAWSAVVVGASICWAQSLVWAAKGTPTPYTNLNEDKIPLQGQPHHYPYLILAGMVGLAWELAGGLGLSRILSVFLVLGVVAVIRVPVVSTVQGWADEVVRRRRTMPQAEQAPKKDRKPLTVSQMFFVGVLMLVFSMILGFLFYDLLT